MWHTRWVIALFWILLLWCGPSDAWALDCGESSTLEMAAYRGRLTAENRTCLERGVNSGEPNDRAQASFVLIIDAYASSQTDRYRALMQRHLNEIHTQDAEVAFLYATHLWREQGASDEVLKWSRVAMDGRRRWLMMPLVRPTGRPTHSRAGSRRRGARSTSTQPRRSTWVSVGTRATASMSTS